MKQRAGDGDQAAKRTRGEHVEDPGRAEQEIGLAIVSLLLQSAEEREEDFADLQDTDIHGLFQPLRNRIKADELRLQ